MARLPKIDGDYEEWGIILNQFLEVSHNGDGSLKPISKSGVTGLTADLAITEKTSNKGFPNGYAGLDISGNVPVTQLGNTPAASVSSVAGKTGAVTLTAGDVGADVAGTAATVQTNLNAETTRAENAEGTRLSLAGGTMTGPIIGFEDKGGQVFNVKAYGAVGDGTTDDTTAIQAAVTAASTAGGGVVEGPAGAGYLITSTLNILSGVVFRFPWQGVGANINTVPTGAGQIKWGGASNGTMLLVNDAASVDLHSFTLNGNGATGMIGLSIQSDNAPQTVGITVGNYGIYQCHTAVQVGNYSTSGIDADLNHVHNRGIGYIISCSYGWVIDSLNAMDESQIGPFACIYAIHPVWLKRAGLPKLFGIDADGSLKSTVATGSNGVDVSTFIGGGTLNVVSTAAPTYFEAGFPSTGLVKVVTSASAVPVTISYTGITSTTLTGCTTLNGGTGLLATGGLVDPSAFIRWSSSPSGPHTIEKCECEQFYTNLWIDSTGGANGKNQTYLVGNTFDGGLQMDAAVTILGTANNWNAAAFNIPFAGIYEYRDDVFGSGGNAPTFQVALGGYCGPMAALTTGGPYSRTFSNEIAISGTTVLTQSDLGFMHACSAATAYTVTLPAPSTYSAGRLVGVRITSVSTNLVTLATAGGNIDGQATRVMWAGESAILESDGTKWVKIYGRTISMRATMTRAAAQSIPNGAATTLLFDTSVTDNTGQMCDPTTNNRINIVRPGNYAVTAQVSLANPGTATPRFIASIKKTGTNVRQYEGTMVATNFPCLQVAIGTIAATASDNFTVTEYQNSTGGGAVNTNTSVGILPTLDVVEIPSW